MKKRSEIFLTIASLIIGGIILFLPLFSLNASFTLTPLSDQSPPPDLDLPAQDVFMDVEPATRIRTNDSVTVEFYIINYENHTVPVNCSVEAGLSTYIEDYSANTTLDPKSSGSCTVQFKANEIEPDTKYEIYGYIDVGNLSEKQLVRREVVLGVSETAVTNLRSPTATETNSRSPTATEKIKKTEMTKDENNLVTLILMFLAFGLLTLVFGSLTGIYLVITLSLFNFYGTKIYGTDVLKRSLEIGFGTGAALGFGAISLNVIAIETIFRLDIFGTVKLYVGVLILVVITGIISGGILLFVDKFLKSITDLEPDTPD